MDPLRFPDDALAVLRQARYDADANRGFDRQVGTFLWSDEWIPRVRSLCAAQHSRAHVSVLAFRHSLILGQPLEEYRRAWEQFQEACPEWPGFRAERCDPHLARALRWEQKLTALLPEPALLTFAFLMVLGLLPLLLALPVGVHAAALNFARAPGAAWFWIGLGLQVVGILVWECFFRLEIVVGRIEDKWSREESQGSRLLDRYLLRGFGVVVPQALTLFLFRMLMDGGVRFWACCHVYLIYAVPALLLVALRWKAWTRAEVWFLRWGWAPILTFGLPLALPLLKAWGWVQVIS